MDRLTSMAVFVKTVDLGSFAATAKAMDMSPQMVAKHVVYLEDRLGTALLNRTTRRQSLTDVGRAYYDRCRFILTEAEAADDLAHDMRSTPKGLLRVNAPTTFGAFGLAPFVTRYLARHEEMQVDLVLSDNLVDPLEEGFEVIVRIGEEEVNGLVSHPLASYRLIACASPAYLSRKGMPGCPGDLVHHDCLVHAYTAQLSPCRWRFFRNGKYEEFQPDGRMRSNDWKALLHAAIEGFGIALGPESVMKAEIEAGQLVQILTDYEGPSRAMQVLYPASRKPTIKVRSFVDALLEEFGKARS